MKRLFVGLFVCCFMLSSVGAVLSAEKRGTAAEAEAMVKKAIALFKASGKEKAFAEINNPKGRFVDRDLYIAVYDMNGVVLAHGFNAKMIGKNLIDLKDPDGRAMVKERIDLAKTQDKFWQRDYKFVDPLTKTIMRKDMYVEKSGDTIFTCGIFK
jgi:cytochrome c